MSGLEVIGSLSAIIGIINASIRIYDSARKDLKLSEAFDTVGRRLPIIWKPFESVRLICNRSRAPYPRTHAKP